MKKNGFFRRVKPQLFRLNCFTTSFLSLLMFSLTVFFLKHGELFSNPQYFVVGKMELLKIALTLFIILLLSYLLARIDSRIDLPSLIFRYRFLLCGLTFVLCVLFEISGSSIGVWSNYLGVNDNGVLLGISRAIRSDEWAVTTPITRSQYYVLSGNIPYFNDVVRAAPTDVFSVAVSAPVNNFLVLFRPFHWGYLFLPFSKGLSFYWCSRMICLWLISFEFGRMITHDRRILSVLYSGLILFSPAIQWWSGGILDMLLAFELATIMLNKYTGTDSYKKRSLYAFIIFWCAGVYIFHLYPAWQIPLFYVMLAVIVWILKSSWKAFFKSSKDILIIVIGIIALSCVVIYFYITSKDAIMSVMNTVYPGARNDSGGHFNINYMFNYISNIWYSFTNSSNVTNPCEDAQFFHLFPISVLLPIVAMLRRKKTDFLSICLLVVDLFLFIYVFIGLPAFITKITLMNMSQSSRANVVWGLTNILLLVRGMYLCSKIHLATSPSRSILSHSICSVLSAFIAGITVYLSYQLAPSYWNSMRWSLVVNFLVLFIPVFLIVENITLSHEKSIVCFILLISLFSGSLINPIRSGESFLEESDTITALEEIESKDSDAIWLVDNMGGLPFINIGLLVGLNTINSTNPYPDLERWHLLDPSGQYEDIYNRYAHIMAELSEEDSFEYISPDTIKLYLSKKGLSLLNVDYILTNRTLDDYQLVKETSLVRIYKVDEPDIP